MDPTWMYSLHGHGWPFEPLVVHRIVRAVCCSSAAEVITLDEESREAATMLASKSCNDAGIQSSAGRAAELCRVDRAAEVYVSRGLPEQEGPERRGRPESLRRGRAFARRWRRAHRGGEHTPSRAAARLRGASSAEGRARKPRVQIR
ncbi:unnamed protein product [Prorocentrum cordatum]|uniref:Uncharacterized protein n=1 Tax=Prorocentrum cordatum TaxID=2364126 RepID=A0ABN9RRC6_9DINO|nr:unnamed protein product [Polarella glacialis]